MKAYIVRSYLTVRVVVPDEYTEEQIYEAATLPVIQLSEANGLMSDVELNEDMENPYDPEFDDQFL